MASALPLSDQLKWREPAGFTQDAEKHNVWTAGFLFFQFNGNAEPFQRRPNILYQ